MKKTVLLFLLFSAFVQAQIVNIPDVNFKQKLIIGNCNDTDFDFVGDAPIDTNSDGEIQVSEALAVQSLIVSNANITDLTGVDFFTNLTVLFCSNNPITLLETSSLQQLGFLECSSTNIASLDFSANPNMNVLFATNCTQLINLNASGVTGFAPELTNSYNIQNLNLHGCQIMDYVINNYIENATNLINLDVSDNLQSTNLYLAAHNINVSGCSNLEILISWGDLTSLDLSGLNNLWELSIHAPLTSIDLNNLPNLTFLDIEGYSNGSPGPLNNLDLTGVPNLTFLNCIGNQISNLDLSNMLQLQELYCGDNQLTSLNTTNCPSLTKIYCSNNPITELDVSANSQLNLLSCGSPELNSLNLKNGQNETLELYQTTNLSFICADEVQVNQVQAEVNTSSNPNTVVNSYCSFTPGGSFNIINGKFTFDHDQNGCDENDLGFPYNILVKITDDNVNGATFPNQAGDYKYYTLAGNFTITPQIEHPEYFVITPESASVNFATQDNLTSIQNFCISAVDNSHPDLEVIIFPNSIARPGFDAYYKIVYKNKGNVSLSGQINLNFDDAHTDFVSANPVIDSQSGNDLYWTFSNLVPFETRVIDVVLNLNSPTENPPLNVGSVLHFVAQTNFSVGESTPYDNTFELNQPVVNSYDPNDKTCLEGNTIAASEIGKYVHYNINFENIGTSEALNIVVKDTINLQMFDINSLQLLYASHPVETKIRDSIVEFIFRGIHLPPSNGGPIGGHGNVLFKIKTLSTLQVGDEIANTANIFFDYNHPIETNEARSAYANLSQSVFTQDESIDLLPNPTKDKATVSALYALKSIEIYDVQGRLLQTIIDHGKNKTIDLSSYSRGIYWVKINTERGSAVEKLIKE